MHRHTNKLYFAFKTKKVAKQFSFKILMTLSYLDYFQNWERVIANAKSCYKSSIRHFKEMGRSITEGRKPGRMCFTERKLVGRLTFSG